MNKLTALQDAASHGVLAGQGCGNTERRALRSVLEIGQVRREKILLDWLVSQRRILYTVQDLTLADG